MYFFRLDALNFAMHDRDLRDNPPSGLSAHEVSRPFYMQEHKYNMSQPEIVDFIEKFRAMLDDYPGTFTVAEVGGPNPIDVPSPSRRCATDSSAIFGARVASR